MDVTTNGHAHADNPALRDGPADDLDPDVLDEHLAPEGLRFTILRALGVIGFLAMAAFWIWAFNNRDSVAHPDTFEDVTYTEAAEAVCVRYQATINSFPLATAAENPVERGVLVERGTAELEQMVAELRALDLPTNPKGAASVPQWLDDWDLYLSDRVAYTEILATGQDPAFLLSANESGARVTDAIQTYAEVNTMASCSPSGDV